MRKGMIAGVFVLVFMIGVVSAGSVNYALADNGGVLTASCSTGDTYGSTSMVNNGVLDGTEFYVTNSAGVYDVVLKDVDLPFSEQYYLGITVESDAEMVPRINLTSSPYAYMAQNVSAGGIIFDSNVNMSAQNLTTTGTGFFG